MKSRAQFIPFVCFLVCAAHAQRSVIVPSKAATKVGNNSNMMIGGTKSYPPRILNQFRTQLFYDVSDISVQGALFKSLQFRPRANSKVYYWATSAHVDVTMSVSPTSHDAMSFTWAQNHGRNKVKVFSGIVNLPAFSGSSWPTPWQQRLVFSKPFVYIANAGKTLVVELLVKDSSSKSN